MNGVLLPNLKVGSLEEWKRVVGEPGSDCYPSVTPWSFSLGLLNHRICKLLKTIRKMVPRGRIELPTP